MSVITQPPAQDPDRIVAETDAAVEKIKDVRAAIGKVIYGQESVIERVLTTLLAGGHGLLIGVPGLAKTKLVETLSTVFGMSERRIQFTPDLMPSDIIGSEVLDQAADGTRSFRFVPGPVFAQLLMADEINRASPRTQSALLQAMQEHHVTVAGTRHDMPSPFHVLATQNPLEQEGTYPLPEAQLDRFLLQIDVTYPDREAERRMLFETTGVEEAATGQVMTPEDLIGIQQLVRLIPIGDSVVEGILNLVRSARPDADASTRVRESVTWGPGPRASQSLMLAARARALIDGRYAPSLDDVHALAEPVLQHRMELTYAARADGLTVRELIAELRENIG